MTRSNNDQTGLDSGRNWGSVPAEEGSMEWSVDREGGLVQGPLDLGFLRGKRILLSLEPGQLALLVGENRLQAVYLDGGHQLQVGNNPNQIPTTSSLIFLAADQPIQLRWTKLDPVTWSGDLRVAAIGHCELQIEAPSLFYAAFLKDTTCWDEQTISRAIDSATREALRSILEPSTPGRSLSEAELQSRLMDLSAEELGESLTGIGLCCTQVALYTATPPAETHSAEKAGQLCGLDHN